MRADAYLAAAEGLPFASLEALTRGRGLVVVAPHPDDESLGCGGLIALARARGLAVRLVVVSDGVGSHPNSPSYPPARLRALREAETLEAARALGLSAGDVGFLRLPDRFVPREGAQAEAAGAAIGQAVRAVQAGAVFVTWAHDPHCDHRACAGIAARACRGLDVALYAYPIWGWSLPGATEVGEPPRGWRLDIAGACAAKARAIAAHRSQTTALIADDPEAFRLEPAMLARFAKAYEIFLDVGPEPPP